jgi:hypothetical protein
MGDVVRMKAPERVRKRPVRWRLSLATLRGNSAADPL